MKNQVLLVALLTVTLLGSGVGVVYTQHANRQLFIELQKLQAKRDDLEVEWELLQLEQSTLVTDAVIEQTARLRLNMLIPDPGEVLTLPLMNPMLGKTLSRNRKRPAGAMQALRTMTRRGLVLSLLCVAAGGMVARAAYLQLVHTDFLQGQGDERFLRVVEVPAHRGMILDRNGEPLAVSSPVDSIWAQPMELKQQRHRWPALASLLGLTMAELEQKLAVPETRQFVYLRRHLAPSVAQRILQLGVPGVYSRREYRRYYPDAEVTSHLLGFTDIDDFGQEGLEKSLDAQLRGIPGSKRVIKDRLGQIVEDVESIQVPQAGQSVVLSIDRRLQYFAYRALKTAVLENKASAGAAVIADALTGEILAMVDQPAGNPNNRTELKSDLLRNRAITDVYEPGSTVKPFTIAMALESGRWTPNTRVNTAPGWLKVGRYRVRDVHNYGSIDVTHVLSKSSNVGTSKIALSLPMESLWQVYKSLGFGASTSVGLVGEQIGMLRHFSKWGGEIGHANHAFGYGFSVNMLQLAQAYVVLAADGVRRPLTLLKREQPPDPADEQRVLSARAVRQVRAMMEEAVSQKGTGFKASVPGYRVAGKTGTVHKIIHGRYASNRYFSLFAGMVPASNPRLVMVIIIDEPKGKAYYGGTVAAPVFGKTMGEVLRILNVTPDDLPSMKIAGVTPAVEKNHEGRGVAYLGSLLAGFAEVPAHLADRPVTGLASDSRAVRLGDLFFAVRGGRRHGLEFIDAVRAAGALAVAWEPPHAGVLPVGEAAPPLLAVSELRQRMGLIASRFHEAPSERLRVVGITGTDGKTSCAHFIAQALSDAEHGPCGILGTLGVGEYGRTEPSPHTTPDPLAVQGWLAQLAAAGRRYAVMEVSSHALDQGRVNGVEFAVAGLTHLTRDHLDYHGTPEAYAAAKRRLFHDHQPGRAVLNLDDAFGRALAAERRGSTEVIAYGLGERPVHADRFVWERIWR